MLKRSVSVSSEADRSSAEHAYDDRTSFIAVASPIVTKGEKCDST